MTESSKEVYYLLFQFLATCSESHTNMWRLGLEEEKPEEEEEEGDEVPSEFYCPITYDLMQV